MGAKLCNLIFTHSGTSVCLYCPCLHGFVPPCPHSAWMPKLFKWADAICFPLRMKSKTYLHSPSSNLVSQSEQIHVHLDFQPAVILWLHYFKAVAIMDQNCMPDTFAINHLHFYTQKWCCQARQVSEPCSCRVNDQTVTWWRPVVVHNFFW